MRDIEDAARKMQEMKGKKSSVADVIRCKFGYYARRCQQNYILLVMPVWAQVQWVLPFFVRR